MFSCKLFYEATTFFQGVQLGIFFERGNTWGDELIHLEYTPWN